LAAHLKQSPESAHYDRRFLVEAGAGYANHLDAGKLQLLLAEPVFLEGRLTAVVVVSVEFHRESQGWPVGVQLVSLDEEIGGRAGQPRLLDEFEEAPL
jgi:hypothetical protein